MLVLPFSVDVAKRFTDGLTSCLPPNYESMDAGNGFTAAQADLRKGHASIAPDPRRNVQDAEISTVGEERSTILPHALMTLKYMPGTQLLQSQQFTEANCFDSSILSPDAGRVVGTAFPDH
jgi:hypothetical protein